jgi:hypothetical protein
MNNAKQTFLYSFFIKENRRYMFKCGIRCFFTVTNRCFCLQYLTYIYPDKRPLNKDDDVYKQKNENDINKKGDPFEAAFVVFRFPLQRNIS